jgi:hypothetical protein
MQLIERICIGKHSRKVESGAMSRTCFVEASGYVGPKLTSTQAKVVADALS